MYDVDDRCPNDKEDHDGYKDTDGCPELDNDGETLFDADDKCPLITSVNHQFLVDEAFFGISATPRRVSSTIVIQPVRRNPLCSTNLTNGP